jgi:hypothetical protein
MKPYFSEARFNEYLSTGNNLEGKAELIRENKEAPLKVQHAIHSTLTAIVGNLQLAMERNDKEAPQQARQDVEAMIAYLRRVNPPGWESVLREAWSERRSNIYSLREFFGFDLKI